MVEVLSADKEDAVLSQLKIAQIAVGGPWCEVVDRPKREMALVRIVVNGTLRPALTQRNAQNDGFLAMRAALLEELLRFGSFKVLEDVADQNHFICAQVIDDVEGVTRVDVVVDGSLVCLNIVGKCLDSVDTN